MGKLLFVDKDDVIVNSANYIQKYIDEGTIFKTKDLQCLEYLISISKKTYEEVKRECERAQQLGVKPNLPYEVKISANDVIRNEVNCDYAHKMYVEPIELALRAYEKTLWDKEMFLERRDCFLEHDNLLSRDQGMVDYDSIYTRENTNSNVHKTILDLYELGIFERMYEYSHHNGGREEQAKKLLNKVMFGDLAPFIGLRFHLEKEGSTPRRSRSSKGLYIKKLFGLSSLSDCYLIDDSTTNLDEWVRCGGKAILYRPFTDEEIISGCIIDHERSYPRIFNFDTDEILDAMHTLKNQDGFSKIKK